ncbi:hypothetical protein NADFUDRAFT_84363 [Nadsonia fulvescens var. elongata DSM 6958]|uniref:Amino acid permease/ SLC12A domain-containing protein n=1 Tax=Nadsonia fulvescens var. elongata DSM 6958 TaxID=857566 RepID=A0A1E3PEE4_9ASCO|nr:hypothetical protein NADFUDRAFT_84363 [Nadsonia fulvescens var. elongata DSM 6958]
MSDKKPKLQAAPFVKDVLNNDIVSTVEFDPLENTMDPDCGVKRGLKTRHLSMLALAGIIGPGLLIGSGGALASGGPASLLIGFGVIGIIAFSVMQSLGELTTLYPTGGAFVRLASRFADRGLGFAVGWNYFIIWVAVLANEYNALTSILTFWSDKVPIWGYFLLFWFFFLGFQLLGVVAFGEAEFWIALIKIVGLLTFFIFAIVYSAGGIIGQKSAVGFQYWHNPGAFADGFRGVASVFVFCSTFYAGCESVAVAAAETKNPSKAVPTAIRQVFWRILIIYMGSALFFGMTVPWNSTGLISAGSRSLRSPMTIALANAGWENGVHLINAFILVTCLSAVNSSIYIGSRTVLFMAQDKMAPKFLGWTSKTGVPIPAIIFTNFFGALSLMNISTGAGQAYQYIVNLSGVSTFLVWGSISFVHLRFRGAWKKQGYTPDDLPFVSMFYPYSAYFGFAANVFLAIVQGWTTLSPFKAGNFVDSYILLPIFFIFIFGYKLIFKTKWVGLEEMDLTSGRRKDIDAVSFSMSQADIENTVVDKKTIWKKISNFV